MCSCVFFLPIAMGMSVQFSAHFWVQTPSSFSTTVRSSCPTATFPSASGATRGSNCFPVGKSSLMEPRPSICSTGGEIARVSQGGTDSNTSVTLTFPVRSVYFTQSVKKPRRGITSKHELIIWINIRQGKKPKINTNQGHQSRQEQVTQRPALKCVFRGRTYKKWHFSKICLWNTAQTWKAPAKCLQLWSLFTQSHE